MRSCRCVKRSLRKIRKLMAIDSPTCRAKHYWWLSEANYVNSCESDDVPAVKCKPCPGDAEMTQFHLREIRANHRRCLRVTVWGKVRVMCHCCFLADLKGRHCNWFFFRLADKVEFKVYWRKTTLGCTAFRLEPQITRVFVQITGSIENEIEILSTKLKTFARKVRNH